MYIRTTQFGDQMISSHRTNSYVGYYTLFITAVFILERCLKLNMYDYMILLKLITTVFII
jgi:hypothetical protein